MLSCLCTKACARRADHCPAGTDPRFSCLEVEPAEDARPEVQATAIELKGTAARRQESMVAKPARLLSGNRGRTRGEEGVGRTILSTPTLLIATCPYSRYHAGHDETDTLVPARCVDRRCLGSDFLAQR